MSIPASNPLFKHFRQPAVYLKLPSQGTFWKESAIDIPATGEIPVYPMTVKDEITFKTPDALMNGEGVVTVIESCCPNIKNAWDVPLSDLDPILISIRIASYGPTMDFQTKCPHCNAENEHTVDLRVLLDNLKTPTYPTVTINNLKFQFKPPKFEALNQVNIYRFEQQKLINAITDSNLSEEEKTAQFKALFPKVTDLNIMSIVNAIDSIVTEDGTRVDNQEHIKEFITNCDMPTYTRIKESIENISKSNKTDPVNLTCSECNEAYKTELNFEEANFFG